MDKVTRQCPQTNLYEEKGRRAEAVSNRGPSAYQPNGLPLGQTGSPCESGRQIQGVMNFKADPRPRLLLVPLHASPRSALTYALILWNVNLISTLVFA